MHPPRLKPDIAQVATASRVRGLRVCWVVTGFLLIAGCAPSTSTREPSTSTDLSGATLTVASKEFTEQLILGEIAVHALEAAGAEVVNRVGLSGSQNVRNLLLDGQVDLYWEYTGTAWTHHLGRTERFATPEDQYQQLAATDLDQHDIRWLTPAPYNNSYAIATAAQTSRSTDVETLSGLAELVRRDPEAVELCVTEEFQTRPDGLPGLQRHYDFKVDADRIHSREIHDLERAVARQDPCNFGTVFTTSGDLTELDLTILDDDQHFFPYYLPAVVVRAETARRYPELVELFDTIAPRLTRDTIIEMNRQVESDGRPPQQVATEWLRRLIPEITP